MPEKKNGKKGTRDFEHKSWNLLTSSINF